MPARAAPLGPRAGAINSPPIPSETNTQPRHTGNSSSERYGRNGDGTGFTMRCFLPRRGGERPAPWRLRGRPCRGRWRQVVGATPRVVGPGRLPGARRAGARRRAAEAVRGRPHGGEGQGAARPDGGHGVVPRCHVPLRHRLPPRTLHLVPRARVYSIAVTFLSLSL
jgi:hypothetical protein